MRESSVLPLCAVALDPRVRRPCPRHPPPPGQAGPFLIHWPLPTLYGGDYVWTWKAIAQLVSNGRLVSNFLPEHLERIIGKIGVAPVLRGSRRYPALNKALDNGLTISNTREILIQL